MIFQVNANVVLTRLMANEILNSLLGGDYAPADAPLDGLKVAFFNNDHTPTPADAIGDYTAADLGGEMDLNDFDGPANLSSDKSGLHMQLDVIAGATPDTETIYGIYAYREGSPDVLRFAARLSTPVNITAEGDKVSMDLVFPQDLVISTGQ